MKLFFYYFVHGYWEVNFLAFENAFKIVIYLTEGKKYWSYK